MKKPNILLIWLMFTIMQSSVLAADAIDISQLQESIDISENVRTAEVTRQHLNALEDDHVRFFHSELIPSSISGSSSFGWQLNSAESISNVSDTGATWIEVVLSNSSASVSDVMLEVERFSGVGWLYKDVSGSVVRQSPAFDAYLGGRVVFDSQFVIPVQLLPDEEKTIFVAVYSLSGAGAGDLLLWEPEAFREDRSKTQFIDAIYFGFLAAFVLYNLFWAVVMRRLTFLYAAGFQFSVVSFIFINIGYGMLFVFPANIGLILPVYGTLLYSAGAFSSLFTIKLLDTKDSNPILHKLWLLNLALAVLPIPIIFLISQPQYLTTSVVFYSIFYSLISFVYSQSIHIYTLYRYWSFSLVARLWFLVVVSQVFFLAVWQILIVSGFGFIEGFRPVVQALTLIEALLLSTVVGLLVRNEQRARMDAQDDALANLSMANDIQQSKSEFIATAGHDLRQPLEAMRFHVSAIKQDASERVGDSINKIESNITELSSLLESLMNLSKSSVYADKEDFQTFSLNETLRSIKDEFEPFAAQKQLALVVDSTEVKLCSSKVGLSQILRNVVENSLKFTKSGEIRLAIHRTGERLILKVEDTGCGIAQDELDNIFNEFYQVEGAISEERSGLGLGLSIVQRLSSVLGVPVNVFSEPDKGTSFEFDLTAIEEEGEWHTEQENSLPTLSGCQVVFLGSASDSSVTIRTLVETWGARVQMVPDFEQFVAEHHSICKPHLLVVSDALYEPLIKDECFQNFNSVPVIILSNLAAEAVTRNSTEFQQHESLHHWFSAPINPGVLRSFIQRMVLNVPG